MIHSDTEYRHTTEFRQAGSLSRLTNNQKCPDKEIIISSLTVEDYTQSTLLDAGCKLPTGPSDIQGARAKDSVLKKAMTYVRTEWLKSSQMCKVLQHCTRRDDLLCRHSFSTQTRCIVLQ
ncbi:unnamed protein product [Hymenolepis diminuta]|uniref:Uncharacterized protein n=1 Tax=Hymenolepis diminuta TaxID=6216 RepID=A0A564YAG7_HYMDI|nr:unnamed protein product [Hymenolepis diminuta]VUZ46338.1 unnamed protein product [Hymenolepis diminuta]